MSWQAYVDDSMLKSGKIARGAILGAQGGIWAISSGYNLSKAEQDFLVKTAFTQPGEAQAHGITLAGTKFMCLQADGEQLLGRKQDRGVVVCKTKQAILVGEYEPPTPAGDANIVMSKLADYLKSVGY
ncbi:profilin, required for normal timing of actin polymerization in response to thermal stress [Naganishia albida]|nr:profilin, required for normal timing of actin polymerization in response to thermal stress [Naganishia albida]